ncbi:MAG: DNA mismatch repair endonuclease MutL [Oscillospiraceae bacterium]|nr:DNA mismatch repair endonuclease MutL [Oscillospiraceae bacterium]
MPQINILPREISELIAAGEVVDRPASVIKELVENSVDAGARQITVEIMNGGVSFMRVTDDGCGIACGQVPTAFMRHATSKTASKEDLENIVTMGFRGEALASVAAVAKIEVLTKRPADKIGTLYKIYGGEELAHHETGCPDGTTIIIRELFYNTPARLKFLKKDVSEANAVQAIVDKLILAHSHIAFRFIRDNKIVRITAGDTLHTALYSVFGKQFAASLIPVDFAQGGIKIGGFVSSPLFCRGNRTMQYFLLNSRPIKSLQIMAAVEEAYKSQIPVGKYPACALTIALNPSEVDVNVHPAKSEVRFANDNAVFDTVYFAVKNALLNAENVKEIELPVIPKEEYRPPLFRENTAVQQEFAPVLRASAAEFKVAKRSEEVFEFPELPELPPISPPVMQNFTRPIEPSAPAPTTGLRVIGELWKTYIICEHGDSLVLIDKHAAHERIRFNALKRELTATSQLLTDSIFINADMRSFDALKQGREILLDAGIEIIPLDKNYVIEVIALPGLLLESDIEAIILEVAEIFAESGGSELGTESIFNEVLHSIACKSAIRANDKTSIADLEGLANAVWSDKNLRYCPHGRPIVTLISRREIEKNFGRV